MSQSPHHPASPRAGSASRQRQRLWTSAAALTLVLAAGGCSAGSGAMSTQPASAGETAGAPATAAAADGQAPGTAANGKSSAPHAVEVGPQLARQAQMSVYVKNVNDAAASVRRLVAAAGGQVDNEQFSTDGGQAAPAPETDPNAPSGTLTVSVPTAALDKTLDQFGALGTVGYRTVSGEDLSGTIVDTTSRVATMRESLARVRALMDRANTLSDVVSLESELTRRQSDLEALEATLAAAKNRVALSPIVIGLSTAAAQQPATTGFLSGLQSGWHGFTLAGSVALTALGTVLPFLLLGLAVGWPLKRWLRRPQPAVPADAS